MSRSRLLTLTSALAGVAVLAALARRWGLGAAHVQRRVPAAPPPPALPPDPEGQPPLQRLRDGFGPLFRRVYRIDFAPGAQGAEAVMAELQRKIGRYCPPELARFEQTCQASSGAMSAGDAFTVHILGPWNGPVRVTEVEPLAFTLATLEGHMEAGQIHFGLGPAPREVRDAHPGALRFRIESWARSRDETVDLAYHRLGLAMRAQQAVWTFFCDRVVRRAGGRRLGRVHVLTEEAPFAPRTGASYPSDA